MASDEIDDETRDALEAADLLVVTEGIPNALDVCRELRASNATWHVPSIYCAETPTQNAVVQALEAGASYVLVLPTDAPTLRRVIDDVRQIT